jgi:hypothetical protein
MKKPYEEIVKKFKENDCELYTTEDDYNLMKKPSVCLFHFKSSCGHDNTVLLTNFVNKSSGVKCKNCMKIHISKKLIDYNKDNTGASSKGHEQENKVFNIINALLSNSLNVTKTYEGCKADFVIKPKDEFDNNWLGIQLKTTKAVCHGLYGFRMHNNEYNNMILLCYCLSDDSMWLIPFNDISHVKCTINIGLTEKSIYNKYRVNKITIVQKLREYYSILKLNNFESYMIPENICQQNEIKYRNIREEYCHFLKFEYPEIEQCYYDFKINGKNVQEKVASKRHDRINCHVVSVCRGRTVQKRKQYELGMNPYYWFHVPDSELFFIIPEFELYNRNYIKSENDEARTERFFLNLKIDYESAWYYKYQYNYKTLDCSVISKLFE